MSTDNISREAEEQFKAGLHYQEIGDDNKACECIRRAAELGHAEAEYKVSFWGNDVKQRIRWLEQSAEHGFAEAQYDLGMVYYNKDRQKALRCWEKFADQGNVECQIKLAKEYEHPGGITGFVNAFFNVKEDAIRWYRKAAEQGNADAQFKLAESYYNGRGVEKNFTEAQYWYSKAADHVEADWKGYSHAAEARDMARKLNSPMWCAWHRVNSFFIKVLIVIVILILECIYWSSK